MLTRIYDGLQARIAAHRRYRRLISEIQSMSEADLLEIGAFQVDLYRAARKQVFG